MIRGNRGDTFASKYSSFKTTRQHTADTNTYNIHTHYTVHSVNVCVKYVFGLLAVHCCIRLHEQYKCIAFIALNHMGCF